MCVFFKNQQNFTQFTYSTPKLSKFPISDRVIKDDWAFALLEDALVDWPNDTEQQKLNFSKIQISEQDSSSLFYKAPRAKHDVVWQTGK